MPKKKEFFIKGKQAITDPTAPVISDEFVDKQPEGDYRGQTIEVQSETRLEDDLGTGQAVVMRTYEFATNPELLSQIRLGKAKFPPTQELFDAHSKGIAGMLWQDGLTPAVDLEPRVIFTPKADKYLIMVWARPSLGQAVIDKTKTLSEIVNESRQTTDSIQRSIPISPKKKATSSRATKAPK